MSFPFEAVPQNGTWKGLLGTLLEGHLADLGKKTTILNKLSITKVEEKIVRFPRWGLISRVYEKNGYTIETLGPTCVRTKSQM